MRPTGANELTDEGRLAALLGGNQLGWSVAQWGFDTVVFRFKIEHPLAFKSLTQPFVYGATPTPGSGVGTFDPSTGAPAIVSVTKAGNWSMYLDYARIGASPEYGLVNVEGRLSALLARTAAERSLADPERMLAGAAAATELVSKVLGGHPLGCEPIVRRADLATDLRNTTGDAQHATDLLDALGATRLARHAPVAYTEPDNTRQGVSWRTKRNKIVFRVYDKPHEMSKAKHRVRGADGSLVAHPLAGPAGHIHRFEREWNPTSPKDFLSPSALLELDLRGLFLGPWQTWLERAGDLAVCGEQAAAHAIAAGVKAGRLSAAQGRNLLGSLSILDHGLAGQLGADEEKVQQNADTALRRAGIVFDRALPRHTRVPVGDVLRCAAAPWPAARAEPRTLMHATGDADPGEQLELAV